MRFVRARVLVLLILLMSGLIQTPAQADTFQLTVAEDKTTGYSRSAFKHWIDSDKNGCDTRAEVLLEEATVTPKIGAKCKLSGGKWLSTYDGKIITNASQLDVDHLVPLAEAWRSGAWKWTAGQRESFANDIEDFRTLIAVSASVNRSKSDKDPALWLPQKEQCKYVENWISVKLKYSLTADAKEANKLKEMISKCGIKKIELIPFAPEPIVSYAGFTTQPTTLMPSLAGWFVYIPPVNGFVKGKMVIPLLSSAKWSSGCYDSYDINNPQDSSQYSKSSPTSGNFLIDNITVLCLFGSEGQFASDVQVAIRVLSSFCETNWCYQPRYSTSPYIKLPELEVKLSPAIPTPGAPTPTPSAQGQLVTPGAFCSPAGAIGNSTSGVTYTCKTSPTDTRNRWRL